MPEKFQYAYSHRKFTVEEFAKMSDFGIAWCSAFRITPLLRVDVAGLVVEAPTGPPIRIADAASAASDTIAYLNPIATKCFGNFSLAICIAIQHSS